MSPTLVGLERIDAVHNSNVGRTAFTVTKRACLDAGRDQRAVRGLGRIEVTTILDHVVGRQLTRMTSGANR